VQAKHHEELQKKAHPFNHIVGSAVFQRNWQCNCSKTNKAIEEQDQSSTPWENTMRSELVFAAMAHVPNRFLLAKLAAVATRKLHRPNTRIQETMDDVLVRFRDANPIAGMQGTGSVQPLRRAGRAGPHSRNAHRSQAAA
jgi:hypothetical protein